MISTSTRIENELGIFYHVQTGKMHEFYREVEGELFIIDRETWDYHIDVETTLNAPQATPMASKPAAPPLASDGFPVHPGPTYASQWTSIFPHLLER